VTGSNTWIDWFVSQ